jgi:hypothetical protein
MFGFFNREPPLEQASRDWLLEHFAWALENFDAELFFRDAQLVEPNNRFFPGRADSVPAMASLVFARVKDYAGVSHWPTRLVDQRACAVTRLEQLQLHGALRGPRGVEPVQVEERYQLQIPFNPQQVNNPEGLIASFAHVLAHHLGQMARTPPPAGPEYWPEVTELLAIYLGFGLMFANSAFTFRGGCGSCYNPAAKRDAALSETEATYALAIFGVLKGIPPAQVTRHLKKHLRPFYRRAANDLLAREEISRIMHARVEACGG